MSEALLAHLQRNHYRFTTVTPLTHERVLKRRTGQLASTLRDAFGWNLPFRKELLPSDLLENLLQRNVVSKDGNQYRSNVRVSTIEDQSFLHSSFPTLQEDSVFFGPDTYRFVRFMKDALLANPLNSHARVLDIGCGTGAGGWMVSKFAGGVQLVLNDINETALKFAKLNVEANSRSDANRVEYALGDSLTAVHGSFDLIIANPPFLVDPEARTYRHGGDKLGRGLALRMVKESLPRLNVGGRMLLYTGVAIVHGVDEFHEDLKNLIPADKFQTTYEEIDPDIFGEELDQPAYQTTDRIAAVGLEVLRR